MRVFAKIGTGPQEEIIVKRPSRELHHGDLERDARVTWKRAGKGEPIRVGIFRGWYEGGIMLEEWE